jgi:hypothetical protein
LLILYRSAEVPLTFFTSVLLLWLCLTGGILVGYCTHKERPHRGRRGCI